jgi:hypothetical protein
MNMSMHKEVGCFRPVCTPGSKPNHLLASSEGIDDSSGAGGRVSAIRRNAELCNLNCHTWIGDGSWVMPQTLGTQGGSPNRRSVKIQDLSGSQPYSMRFAVGKLDELVK